MTQQFSPRIAFALITAGCVIGLAGIDLVLPAVPLLPEALETTVTGGQYVIAAYVAGSAVGLFVFGSLGARFGYRRVLSGALALFALLSFACALSQSIEMLVALRFWQGFASAAAPVLAPGLIRRFYDEAGATRAIGLLGSMESLVPAGAPIVGVWLLTHGDWSISFDVLAGLSAVSALTLALSGRFFPPATRPPPSAGFMRLLGSKLFARYALGWALVLGGLLVFVFAAPSVIVHSMDGEIRDFIVLQVTGVACFILAANTTGLFAQRWGAERMILIGTVFAALAATAILVYAIAGGRDPAMLPYMYVVFNMGLGLAGPPCFLRAIIAGAGDDDRASSLSLLAILVVSSGGTALLAPFIEIGLVPLSAAVAALEIGAVALLIVLPPMEEAGGR